MKWLAITGATGFIGRSICHRLHNEGWKLRVLTRSASRGHVDKEAADDIVVGHLHDAQSLAALVDGVEAVIHCAGAVRGASKQQFDKVNVEGLRNLITAISACVHPPRLLALSSLAARESSLSHYASSKCSGEQVLKREAAHLRWIALRPPAVYGPGDRELLPLFKAMAKGFAPIPATANARFSMLYVEDLAAAISAWLVDESVENGIYSLHDGRQGGYSWQDVVLIVSELCQRRIYQVRIHPALLVLPALVNRWLGQRFAYAPMLTPEKLNELRHPDWVCDNQDITRVLDWKPSVQLMQGLQKTPGWCRLLDGKFSG